MPSPPKKIIFLLQSIFTFILLLVTCFFGCKNSNETKSDISNKQEIICRDNFCKGEYAGPEFVNSSDVAHQFSNTMSKAVGDKLKQLYKEGNYSKVNFEKIEMSTNGMGSGEVIYYLHIPFEKVMEKCAAYTSFDHVGGWNHSPALASRKEQLNTLLLPNQKLFISDLITTKEGLQEYWIQWKNKEFQQECK